MKRMLTDLSEDHTIFLCETNLLMSLILFGKIRKTGALLENTNPSGGEIAAINRVVCERKSGWI